MTTTEQAAKQESAKTPERWSGARSSTVARTDEDAGMAYAALPKGATPYTRDEARAALITMITDEIRDWSQSKYDEDAFCVSRLVAILAKLALDPAANAAEVDGLRFSIWAY